MKQSDGYADGPHDFWIHFWCGLVFGAVVGFFVCGDVLDSAWALAGGVAIFSVAIAYACGRWGDRAWQRIICGLSWFF